MLVDLEALGLLTMSARRRHNREATLEQAVPAYVAPEAGSAQPNGITQGRTTVDVPLHVLKDVRQTTRNQKLTGRCDKINMLEVPIDGLQIRAIQARRARMDHVEAIERERQRVGLMKLERVPWLRVDVHTHDLEAGASVPDRTATSPAEEI
jgi:hypothetical protein